jgi:hypothetical protein
MVKLLPTSFKKLTLEEVAEPSIAIELVTHLLESVVNLDTPHLKISP